MTLSAVPLTSTLHAALREELEDARALRRRLHAAPRVSGDEADTTAMVVGALGAGPGWDVAGTGRVVVLGGRSTDGCVALRAELDALPVTEETGVPWSAAGGAMHACGHDVHLAATVAACRAIARSGAPMAAAALLQPREETAPSGALDIVASGLLDELGVRAVVGAHVQPQVAPGRIAVTPGLVNASVDEFQITVHGSGGHAGYPHTVRDPVLALAGIVLSLQQIAARRIDPVHGAVCMVSGLSAGTATNVVPSTARAFGSLRLMRAEDRTRAAKELVEIVQASAAAYGCQADVRLSDGEPALSNDAALAGSAAATLRADGRDVVDDFRSFGADDFAHYSQRMPALMMFVGVDGGAGLHDPRFLPPDDAVDTVALALLAGYVAAAGRSDHGDSAG
jgi:amidohydrolase